MPVSRRVSVVLVALALILQTIAFPITQAKATAAALTAAGFGVTLCAFMSMCGIHPFIDTDGSSAIEFPEWEGSKLQEIVDMYNATSPATGPIYPNNSQGFIVGSSIAITALTYNRFRDFVQWIKNKFSVADNQAGIELGETSDGWPVLPVSSGFNSSASNADKLAWMSQHGYPVTGVSQTAWYAVTASSQPVYIFAVRGSFSDGRVDAGLYSLATFSSVACSGSSSIYPSGTVYYYSSPYFEVSSLPRVYYEQRIFASLGDDASPYAGSLPYFASYVDACNALRAGAPPAEFEGITVDTSAVSVPAELPEDTEWTGMRVTELPAATPAETVQEAIKEGVLDREQVEVVPVDVEIAPGTDIDSETGELTENPVVIEAPVVETIPAVSELTAPQAFLDSLATTMQTKFPFCLPFDAMKILSACVKTPSAPVISLTFHDPFTNADYTVSVDLSPWDSVASVVRQLESAILFLGFWLNFDKFNVLNIILGQLG